LVLSHTTSDHLPTFSFPPTNIPNILETQTLTTTPITTPNTTPTATQTWHPTTVVSRPSPRRAHHQHRPLAKTRAPHQNRTTIPPPPRPSRQASQCRLWPLPSHRPQSTSTRAAVVSLGSQSPFVPSVSRITPAILSWTAFSASCNRRSRHSARSTMPVLPSPRRHNCSSASSSA